MRHAEDDQNAHSVWNQMRKKTIIYKNTIITKQQGAHRGPYLYFDQFYASD